MDENPTPQAGRRPGDNLPVLSVSELSLVLKNAVEEQFPWVRVRGEISGFKRPASGHLYFALKDTDAVLDAVCWRGQAGRIGLKPEDGMEVVAMGRLTTYPGRSKYQMIVERLELAGEGALLKLLEERKKKLAVEGLFAPERKKKIPFLPDVIGVVTSPTGAVIRDILHRLGERFPRRVLLWPVRVQGEEAAAEIAAAIEGFNRLEPGGAVPRPDVLIVARGGGSLEDLWAFNEEIVVRAAAASAIPLISAVGHETDTTLIDFASDLRAPTPTAAAEMAVPVRIELLARTNEHGARLAGALQRTLVERQTRLADLARALPRLPQLIEEQTQRLDDWVERLGNCLRVGMERKRGHLAELSGRLKKPNELIALCAHRLKGEVRALGNCFGAVIRDATAKLERTAHVLETVSYRSVLARGYAVVRDQNDHALTAAAQMRAGVRLSIEFHDGRAGAVADGSAPPREPTPERTTAARPKDTRQGKLL